MKNVESENVENYEPCKSLLILLEKLFPKFDQQNVIQYTCTEHNSEGEGEIYD